MRIPRLLEVLGRVGRQQGGTAATTAPVASAPRPGGFVPEPRPPASSPRLYVEDVGVRTGRLDALEAKPPGFQVPPAPDAPAAPGPAPARPAARPRGARERISVTSGVEGGGQPLRRPPAATPRR